MSGGAELRSLCDSETHSTTVLAHFSASENAQNLLKCSTDLSGVVINVAIILGSGLNQRM